MGILASFIGHDRSFFRDVGAKNRNQMRGGRASNMKAADLTAALDKRQNRMLVREAAPLRHIGFVADESFVDFDDHALAAHRCKASIAHRLAKAMRHEPSGLITYMQRSVKLMGG